MKVVPSDKRPCRLGRGEVRRVPQRRESRLVGYHIACPRCGFVCIALAGDRGLVITEATDPADLTLSHPLRCTFCRVLLRIQGGEIRLEEDADVHHVSFR